MEVYVIMKSGREYVIPFETSDGLTPDQAVDTVRGMLHEGQAVSGRTDRLFEFKAGNINFDEVEFIGA